MADAQSREVEARAAAVADDRALMISSDKISSDGSLRFAGSRFGSFSPYATLLSGILTHLTFGTLYCWGNFQSYLPPSMRYFSSVSGLPPSRPPDALLVIPIAIIFMCISMPLSARYLHPHFRPHSSVLIGSLLMSGAVFLSSYVTTLEAFLFLYSIVFGIGLGIAYTPPLVAGWSWFPKSRGAVSGLILAGFGSGGFIFNILGSTLVNPQGLSPAAVAGTATRRFPPEVYARFPAMLRTLAITYMSMQGVAALLLSPPAVPAKQASQRQPLDAPAQQKSMMFFFRDPAFQVLWLTVALSSTAGLNTATLYKLYGSTSPNPRLSSLDSTLALIGGFGAMSNGLSRPLWGYLADRLGFPNTMLFLSAVQCIVISLYPLTLPHPFAFGVATCLVFACLGGNFAMAPGACAALYGASGGPLAFSTLFSSFAVASVGGAALNKRILKGGMGFEGLFRAMAALAAVAGIGAASLKKIEADRKRAATA